MQIIMHKNNMLLFLAQHRTFSFRKSIGFKKYFLNETCNVRSHICVFLELIKHCEIMDIAHVRKGTIKVQS